MDQALLTLALFLHAINVTYIISRADLVSSDIILRIECLSVCLMYFLVCNQV